MLKRERKPRDFFDGIKGKPVKVYLSVTDPPVFYAGIFKDFDDSTFILETPEATVLINSASAISIEVPKVAVPQNKGGH